MKKAAVIAAAGWKGVGYQERLADCPATILPLRDGTTILSRLVAQLRGFEIFIAVGMLESTADSYPVRRIHFEHPKPESLEARLERLDVSPKMRPWTPERHEYIGRLGTIVPVEAGGFSCHNTFCFVMDYIGYDWDRTLLIQGDNIFTTEYITRIIEKSPWPCQYQMHPAHSIFLLDRAATKTYRGYAEAYRTHIGNKPESLKQPDERTGTVRLAKLGIPHWGPHKDPMVASYEWLRENWYDIDDVEGYAEIKGEILNGKWA